MKTSSTIFIITGKTPTLFSFDYVPKARLGAGRWKFGINGKSFLWDGRLENY